MKKLTFSLHRMKAENLLINPNSWRTMQNLSYATIIKGIIFTLILVNLFVFKELSGQITYNQTSDDDFKKGFQENVVVSGGKVYPDVKATSPTAWLSTTILPQSLTRHQTAVYQNFAYLVGGSNGTTYSSNVYRSTLSNSGVGAWTLLNNLPEPLIDHQVVTGVNYLYVLGGKNQANQISNKIYYSMLNVSGAIGNWTISSVSLPEPLWGMKAICINGFLYVAGGSANASPNSASDKVYFSKIGIDGRLSEFVETTAMPEARNGHTIAAYDSKLFVIGGFNNSGMIVNTVYYAGINLDGTCTAWQTATNLPINICNHATTFSNGLITVMGGDNGTSLLKTTYYANLNDYPNFTWTLSPNELYDYVKCGQAMSYNGRISFAGGENLSGAPLQNTRYTVTNQSTLKVNSGCFVSFPFTQLGDVRNLERIAYTITYAAPNTFEMFYRLAGNNGNWGSWVNCGTTNPQLIGQQAQYLQYMVRFRSTNENNIDFQDLTLTITGSQLSGNLNAIDTLRIENSPYLVTGNITFTAGNHVIEPGVTILFSPNTGLEIGQANLKCNGTETDSIKFTSYNVTPGEWNGVYFNDNSDNGVSSQFSYTIIEKAGFGTWDANLYCYNTTEPAIENCTFRKALGYGVSLYNADLSLEAVQCKQNDHGLLLRNSDPSMIDVDLLSNMGAGLYYYDETSYPNFTSCLSQNNGYGVYVPTPDRSFQTFNAGMQVVNNGSYYGVAGGGIRVQRTWEYFEDGYTILGNITVYSNTYNTTNHARLTLTAGTTLCFAAGVQLQIGYYESTSGGRYYGGELYAIGTEENPITFTSLNGAIGGWNGLYFENASDYSNATSSLKHCIIENGSSYNVYCVYTIQPSIIENCTFRNSAGYGVRLYDADNITFNNCEFENTASDGLYSQYSSGLKFNNCSFNNSQKEGIELYDSDNPDFINCFISNSQGKGLYLSETQTSDIIGCTIQNCDTAMYLYNSGICKLDNTIIQNNDNGIWSNHYVEMYNSSIINTAYPGFPVWANFMYAFPLLVNSTIEDNNTPITIGGSPLYYSRTWPYFAQGNIVIANAQVYYATYNTTNHARLTIAPGNTIRFAPGVQLQIGYYDANYNRYYGGELFAIGMEESPITFTSLNGTIGGWNGLYFENASDYSNATSSLKHCIIENGSSYNMYCATTIQPSLIENCIFRNSSGNGLKLYDADNITFNNCEFDNTASDGLYSQYSSGLKFNNCSFSNSLKEGIELYDSDNPDFINCIISNVQGRGLYLSETQTTDIIGCTIQNCDTALYVFNSGICKLDNTQIQNNNNGVWSNHYVEMYNSSITNTAYPGFPVWANYIYGFPLLVNSTIEDNNTSINIGGGDLRYSRYWPYFEQGYILTTSARIFGASANTSNHARLTISSGNTIRFASGVQLQFGYTDSYHYGGELFADGTEENPITFTSLNGAVGGWNGLYFQNSSDAYGATSSLKHCIIENGNDYNVYCENTIQPTITRTLIKNSKTYGLKCYEASPTISSSFIINNLSNGIYLQNNSQPTIGNSVCTTNDIYGNGVYDIYNNTNKNINARYNYWNSIDPGFIGARIYDKADNTALGTVYYEPLSETSLSTIPELMAVENSLVHVDCFGYSTGAINITPTGGIPPFQFLWSNQATTEDISNLTAGNYTLTLTDSRGCSSSKTFTITQPATITLVTSGTNVSCPDCYDGTVSVVATGGTVTANYSYLWDDPDTQTTQTADGLGVGTYTVTVTDDNGCFSTASFTIIDITGHTISGNIHYDNTVSTNLSNTLVFLENTLTGAYFSSMTDIYGSFDFPGIPDGNYSLNASPTIWGGVNATDALLILKHPAPALTGLRLEAGDVNQSGYVNASDATLVLQRSVHLINSFPSGNWYFETTELTMDGENVDIDFDGICYGDVNGSYNPPYTSDESKILTDTYDDLMNSALGSRILNLPVKINRNADVAAITLNVKFNDEYFSFSEIAFKSGMNNVLTSVVGNEIRIGWCNLMPVSLLKGDVLFNLKLEVKNPNYQLANFLVSIGEESEFANIHGDVISSIKLLIPNLLKPKPNGKDQSNSDAGRTNQFAEILPGNQNLVTSYNLPNPFTSQTEIFYQIPVSGHVNLSIYDVYGKKVSVLVNEIMDNGSHVSVFDANDLKPGVYFYQISLDNVHVVTNKMVLTK